MYEFNLIHLSDIHTKVWRKWGGDSFINGGKKYLRRAVARWTNDYVDGNKADALIITGDLADDGTSESMTEAAWFVLSPPASGETYIDNMGRPTLGGLSLPIWVFPGNHDRYVGDYIPRGSPGAGGVQFDAHFSALWNKGANGVQRFDMPVPSSGDKLCVIAADLCLEKQSDAEYPNRLLKRAAIMGQGRAKSSTIDKLRKETESAVNEGWAVVWAVHFPPAFNIRYPKWVREANYLRLLDESLVISAANACEIRHILTGHTHRRRNYQIPQNKVIVHCGPGTAGKDTSADDISTHVHRVVVDANVIRDFQSLDFVWDRDESTFLEKSPIVDIP